MDVFETCQNINDLLQTGDQVDQREARNLLIRLLDMHASIQSEYSPLINHMIREVGLYPYIQTEEADWQDRFVCEAFKADVGGGEQAILHREQSYLLKRLLDKEDIAVSAPTSFGKSFVIDAFIATANPTNVVIIVPTIALTDETRRRLYRKFANTYNFVTTVNAPIAEKNIFIFPAERAIAYSDKIPSIDILIVDEFYKASAMYDKERASALLRAIINLAENAKQRYYLAPNIENLGENPFTKGMAFEKLLDFNTVFLNVSETYKNISGETEKSEALLEILGESDGKSLIYAGTYPDVEKVSNLLLDKLPTTPNDLPNEFAEWLSENYEPNWKLTNLARRGVGIHNGSLHRSIAQLQIRLFEEPRGFQQIISTSSIIEGVNTSAENVIIWRNKNGNAKINDFTYKNIIGRSGRMFRHFVGKVFLLEPPPAEEAATLEIPFPDSLLGHVDELVYSEDLTDDQIDTIQSFRDDMYQLMGKSAFDELMGSNLFQSANTDLVRAIAQDMKSNPSSWRKLLYLHSDDPDDWNSALYKLLNIRYVSWEAPYSKIVAVVKAISFSWEKSISEILDDLAEQNIGIDDFFKIERVATFKLASVLNDVNLLQQKILDGQVNVADFAFKLAHAFLPPVVHQLEEYGLPRMVAKRIHDRKFLDLTSRDLDIRDAISRLRNIGKERLLRDPNLMEFDRYIINYFYEGIATGEEPLKRLEA